MSSGGFSPGRLSRDPARSAGEVSNVPGERHAIRRTTADGHPARIPRAVGATTPPAGYATTRVGCSKCTVRKRQAALFSSGCRELLLSVARTKQQRSTRAIPQHPAEGQPLRAASAGQKPFVGASKPAERRVRWMIYG
ncbi:hypothetical protein Vse01_39260 [Micromonospora sediminimaris]|uniref:Uncharacterized protein n=1 Tax=Micromonospora sediminimaris TaxID=547162 RepID=A0A9W5UV43_9ACTN|nr:hypothetical protein Vse01_39260 [Micromonospora sediminimaris]